MLPQDIMLSQEQLTAFDSQNSLVNFNIES